MTIELCNRIEVAIELARIVVHALEDAVRTGNPETLRKAEQRAALVADRLGALHRDARAEVMREAAQVASVEA